jgi:hypothetical protein
VPLCRVQSRRRRAPCARSRERLRARASLVPHPTLSFCLLWTCRRGWIFYHCFLGGLFLQTSFAPPLNPLFLRFPLGKAARGGRLYTTTFCAPRVFPLLAELERHTHTERQRERERILTEKSATLFPPVLLCSYNIIAPKREKRERPPPLHPSPERVLDRCAPPCAPQFVPPFPCVQCNALTLFGRPALLTTHTHTHTHTHTLPCGLGIRQRSVFDVFVAIYKTLLPAQHRARRHKAHFVHFF